MSLSELPCHKREQEIVGVSLYYYFFFWETSVFKFLGMDSNKLAGRINSKYTNR